MDMNLFPVCHVLIFRVIILKRPPMASYYVPVVYSCQDFSKAKFPNPFVPIPEYARKPKRPDLTSRHIPPKSKLATYMPGRWNRSK